MDNYISTLKNIERELVAELQKQPIFIKLESLRKTIKDFEGNNGFGVEANIVLPTIGMSVELPRQYAGYGEKRMEVPLKYDPEKLTWRERVIYVVNGKPMIGLGDIITEIGQREPRLEKKFLTKRIGVTVSTLKTDGCLDVKSEDGRYKYFVRR
jgi:hypothetical protein